MSKEGSLQAPPRRRRRRSAAPRADDAAAPPRADDALLELSRPRDVRWPDDIMLRDRLGRAWQSDDEKDRYASSLAATCEARLRALRPDELFVSDRGRVDEEVLRECFAPALDAAISRFPAKLRADHCPFAYSRGPDMLDSPASEWAGGFGLLGALVKHHGLAPEPDEEKEEEEEEASFFGMRRRRDSSRMVLEHPKFSESPTVGELVGWYNFYTEFSTQYNICATAVHQRRLRENLAAMRQRQQEREQTRTEIKDALRTRLEKDGLEGASVADLKKICKVCDLAHKSGTKAQLIGRLQKYVDGTAKRRKSAAEASADRLLSLFDPGRPKKQRRRR